MIPPAGYRYVVGYALACGNTWDDSAHALVQDAFARARALSRELGASYRLHAEFVYDAEDPERGTLHADLYDGEERCD